MIVACIGFVEYDNLQFQISPYNILSAIILNRPLFYGNTMKRQKKLWLLSPTLGMILFVLLYYIATLLYPGGSYFHTDLTSFSWQENYWCDLLKNPTLSNKNNPATAVAEFAMIIAMFSISLFWINSTYLYKNKQYNLVIQLSGSMGSISLLLLMVRGFHDIGLIVAGSLSLCAITITLYKLFKERKYLLFITGLVSILISVLSYTLYFSGSYITAIPIIQKVNFLIIILWIILMNIASTSTTATFLPFFSQNFIPKKRQGI